MKRLLLVLILVMAITPVATMADDYTKLWKEHQTACENDLPQTAIKVLDRIEKKATREESYGQLLKARLKRIVTEMMISPDSLDVELERIEESEREVREVNPVLASVYECVLGKVYKNLEFVLKATGWHDKERINDRIGEVLTMIGLEDKADKMPHELSGGEQQRVAIARAILNSPQLIIADEPTGNLDRDTADNIMQLLRSICEKGTAVIMTTHNMSLVNKYPGKAFQCHNGILEQVVVRKANEAKEVKE